MVQFQSTHPMRDATDKIVYFIMHEDKFQSTHPMRDATTLCQRPARLSSISIHASHAGCDVHNGEVYLTTSKFQSTHPMRDATCRYHQHRRTHHHISIHASHAGCDHRSPLHFWNTLYFNPRIPCGMRLLT